MIYFFLTGTEIHRGIEFPNDDRAIAYRDEEWPKARFGANQPQIAMLIEGPIWRTAGNAWGRRAYWKYNAA